MSQRSMMRGGAIVLAASMALAACGSRDAGEGTASTGGGEGKMATIGVIAPLSGDLASLGKGIENSVKLAVQQANDAKTIPGWTLKVDAKDDEAKPDVGKNAATALAGDKTVIGVVGTLNSSVALSVAPVLASANIVQVSPANTNPSLTKGADFATAPKRVYATYFRTCTTDAVQGPFAARYLYNTVGAKKVATIHDKKAYGQGLVDAFSEEYKKLGGEIVAAETINPDDANYQTVVGKVKPTAPAAVYYGGEFPQAGPLSQQMKAGGLNVPLMGGDGIFAADFIKLAGKTAAGDLATAVGAPLEKLAKGAEFQAAYEKAAFPEPYEAYGAYAYDAAQAIIEALKVSLASATAVDDASKKATIDALGKVSFEGVTGPVSFDEFGDTTSRVLTVYKVEGDAWVASDTQTFE